MFYMNCESFPKTLKSLEEYPNIFTALCPTALLKLLQGLKNQGDLISASKGHGCLGDILYVVKHTWLPLSVLLFYRITSS